MSNLDFCSVCETSNQRLEEGVCPQCGAFEFGQVFVPEAEMSPATKRIIFADDHQDQTDQLGFGG